MKNFALLTALLLFFGGLPARAPATAAIPCGSAEPCPSAAAPILTDVAPTARSHISAAALSSTVGEPMRYAAAPDTNVWFYTSEAESAKLFLLPDTYYVRVLSRGAEYTAVEYLVNDPPYKKLMGYCKTDALLFVDFIPVRPYLFRTVTVTYTLPAAGGALGGEFSAVEKEFVYYGTRYESGDLYFYVLEGETFGFIPAEAPLDYERNDDFLTAATPDAPSAAGRLSGWQTALICLAVAVAALLGLFVLKRSAPPAGDPDP